MRTINLNGYIDEEVWYGDEITPAMLHDALYGENGEFSDDVRIVLNSYGGSCNAAVRMHDDIRAYPGKVHLVISGTAASAATVLSAAADTLEMTPGSLYMIHDPSTVAWGIVGGEQYILSAVMHADERNQGMSKALRSSSRMRPPAFQRRLPTSSSC